MASRPLPGREPGTGTCIDGLVQEVEQLRAG